MKTPAKAALQKIEDSMTNRLLAIRDAHPELAHTADDSPVKDAFDRLYWSQSPKNFETFLSLVNTVTRVLVEKMRDELAGARQARKDEIAADKARRLVPPVLESDKPKSAMWGLTNGALQPYKELVRSRHHELLTKQLAHVVGKLEAHGMDLDRAFPAPSKEVRNQFERHGMVAVRAMACRFCMFDVRAAKGVPLIAVVRGDVAEFIDREAGKLAEATIAAYVCKLARKVEAVLKDLADVDRFLTVTGATYTGSLWGWSVVSYKALDGGSRKDITFKTRMILNHSVYGKPFNQFPTTLTTQIL